MELHKNKRRFSYIFCLCLTVITFIIIRVGIPYIWLNYFHMKTHHTTTVEIQIMYGYGLWVINIKFLIQQQNNRFYQFA